MWFVWPMPIYLGVVAILIVLFSVGRRLFPWTFGSRRAFWCPFLKKNVDVDFRRSVWGGRLLDVHACTAFSSPQDVQCEKSCLLLGRFQAVKAEVARATPL